MLRARQTRSASLLEQGLAPERQRPVRPWAALCALALGLLAAAAVFEAHELASAEALVDGCAPIFGRSLRVLALANTTTLLWFPSFVPGNSSAVYRVVENSSLCSVPRVVRRHHSGTVRHWGGTMRVEGVIAFCVAHAVDAWAGACT